MTAQIEDLKKSWSKSNGNKDKELSEVKQKSWRFSNTDNKVELRRNGRTYKWCMHDCHPRHMWYPRPICMNHSDYKKKKDAERTSPSSDIKITNPSDFKVTLSAMCNENNYKMLEEQFLGKAE